MKIKKLVSAITTKNQTIRKNVKICVECGSFSLQKEKSGIYCKNCGKFFDIKEDSK